MTNELPVSATESLAPTDLVHLELDDLSLVVDRERIRIGSSPVCEIVTPQGPPLQSVLHWEDGVLWIEQDDESSELLVNWRLCRRMALRANDVISVSGLEITVRRGAVEQSTAPVADLTQLTADELCNHILTEQPGLADSGLTELETGPLNGWMKLMTAIRDVAAAERQSAALTQDDVTPQSEEDCERLLEQIQEMSEMMTGQMQELDLCEGDLLAATSLLEETQDRVSRQIEELIDQIGGVTTVSDLRASA